MSAFYTCHFCFEACTAEDFCFGCGTHCCRRCDHPVADKRPHGPHKPEAHRAHVAQGALS